jgi:hypothetical protein
VWNNETLQIFGTNPLTEHRRTVKPINVNDKTHKISEVCLCPLAGFEYTLGRWNFVHPIGVQYDLFVDYDKDITTFIWYDVWHTRHRWVHTEVEFWMLHFAGKLGSFWWWFSQNRNMLEKFYVHVTVHRNKFLYNKTNQMHQFPKFTPAWNSTCFGQFLCPTSGVSSLNTRHWYMSYIFEDSCQGGPGWNCSSILLLLENCLQTCMTYTIAECTVKKLLMMGRGTARNM